MQSVNGVMFWCCCSIGSSVCMLCVIGFSWTPNNVIIHLVFVLSLFALLTLVKEQCIWAENKTNHGCTWHPCCFETWQYIYQHLISPSDTLPIIVSGLVVGAASGWKCISKWDDGAIMETQPSSGSESYFRKTSRLRDISRHRITGTRTSAE